MKEFTDKELTKIASEINGCFDNGCGCCSGGDDDLDAAVKILRKLLKKAVAETTL